MSIAVKIPPMGESIASGILAKWHVRSGDTVKKDQVLYELETDKITSEGTAEADGTITLAVAAGTEVKIGQVVAEIAPGSNGDRPTDTAESQPAAQPAPAGPRDPSTADSPPLSPAVRRIAAETGIDPATVAGSGKGGRITKGDILAAAEKRDATAPSTGNTSPAPPPASQPSEERTAAPIAAAPTAPAPAAARPVSTRRKLTPLRAKIAQRLVAAKNETAMLTTFNEVDMTAVRELRARHQETFTKKHGVKLGFMSFFVKAVVSALREVPAINAFIDGDEVIQHAHYDIGVAVSTDRGLMVPVLRDCHAKNMAEIERDLADYAKKARDGKIALADLEGGVFTITNGGIFGSLLSTPILNPPQSGILGMHTIQERPIALNGQVVVRPMMYLALSYDHRIVDGREAVGFLVHVKQVIEDPARLLLAI